MTCDSFFPYFVLVKEGRAIGLGWQIIGKTPEHGRDWFENPPARAVEVTKIVMKQSNIMNVSNS